MEFTGVRAAVFLAVTLGLLIVSGFSMFISLLPGTSDSCRYRESQVIVLSLSCINGEALTSRSLPVRIRLRTEVIARTLGCSREVRSQGRTEDRDV